MRNKILVFIAMLFLTGCDESSNEPVIRHSFNEGDIVAFKADENKIGIVVSMNRWRGARYYTYQVKFSIPSSEFSNGNELFRYSNCNEYELVLKREKKLD